MKKTIFLLMAFTVISFFIACEKDDDEKEETTITEQINNTTTWTSDKEWIVEGIVEVGSMLTIEPGTIVKFKEGSGLVVGSYTAGGIIANGTDEEPIIFTSAGSGKWGSINLLEYNNSNSTVFKYCTFNNASDYAAVILSGTKAKFENCLFTNCSESAISVEYEGEFNGFWNNSISSCGSHPILIEANAVTTIDTGNVFNHSDGQWIKVTNNFDLTDDGTWKNLGIPYYIEHVLNIDADLVIEDSVTICFAPEAGLEIGYNNYASLKAIGTENKMIRFTSASFNPQPGDWQDISFYSNNSASASELSYCIFEYGGNLNDWGILNLVETSITMKNCIVKNSEHHGVVVDASAKFNECKNNTISNCGSHPVSIILEAVYTLDSSNTFIADEGFGIYITTYYSSVVTGNVTWQKFDIPYILQGDAGIGSNAELTLLPGTVLKFAPSTEFSV